MNDVQKAAFLQTQATCAIIMAIAILLRSDAKASHANKVEDLIAKYGIEHNTVISYLLNYTGS